MTPFNHDHYLTLWARQLSKEFVDICWGHQLALAPPVIEIFSSARHLGEWHQATQTIKISSHLILHHPWLVTINVLKHEMAHQLCAAEGSPEAGHGPIFQAACARLGVPPPYRSGRGDTPALFTDLESDSQLVQEGRRFFAKVEKLLALAQSPNEHEAALAMQKANALIERYNLQQLASEAKSHYTHAIINLHKQSVSGCQRSICTILRDFFFVRIIQSQAYDPLSDQHHKTIELFGRAENVAVAEYCYHFLERELALLWGRNKSRFQGQTLRQKNSYCLGVLHGFHQKLKEQQAAKPAMRTAPSLPAAARALTVITDPDLDEFIGQRFPRLRTVRRAGGQINRSTYSHGAADGKNIILRQGVAGQDGNQGRLLTE